MMASEAYNSKNNKSFMWKLMIENEMFAGISSNYMDNIIRDFESVVANVENTEQSSSLIEKNKLTISEMVPTLNKYRNQSSSSLDRAQSYNSDHVHQQRQKLFQQGVEHKQTEFNSMINPIIPQNIDFTDKHVDKPIGSEMDDMLAKTIAWREKELNLVLDKQDLSSATKWLNIENMHPEITKTSSTTNPKLLKIGEELKTEAIIEKKNVNFIDQPSEQSNVQSNESITPYFLTMLKRKNVKSETAMEENSDNGQAQVIAILGDIIRKEDIIIAMLQKLTTEGRS